MIVHRKKAFPAESITQIREVLGVRVADNLSAAEFVLLVEGSEDTRSLEGLLPAASPKLEHALAEGRLVIDDMHGTGNLRYRLALMADQLCRAHVLLDHDDAGIGSAKTAHDEGLLEPLDQTFTTSAGMKQSEFEDWIATDVYLIPIKRKFGVDLDSKVFRQRKGKWSKRVQVEFQRAGQLWDDDVKASVKDFVAGLVAASPADALRAEWATSFDALVLALETKLDEP